MSHKPHRSSRKSSRSDRGAENVEEEMDTGQHSVPHHSGPIHMQGQLLRSIEASKQMLYGTYGNVISILEEFERREMEQLGRGHILPKSNIPIPKQDHKTIQDIESIVNTQLLLFETQTRACPPEVLAELRDELKRRTISWVAVRSETGVKDIHKTDHYLTKLYEILAKGSTQHNIPNSDGVTEETMKESFQAILQGSHDRDVLDEQFKKDRDKQAVAPDMRSSEMLAEGAHRINLAKGNNELGHYLQSDIHNFHHQGPGDLK